MALRIPARNVAGDQIMESVTNASTREEQVMRLGGTFSIPPVTGTIVVNGQAVLHTAVSNAGNAMIMVYGTYAGITPVFEGLISAGGNTTWIPITGTRIDTNKPEYSPGSLTNATMAWQFDISGFDQFRLRATSYGSGTMNVIVDPIVAWGEPVVASNLMHPAGAVETRFYYIGAGSTTEAIGSNLQGVYRNGVAGTLGNSQAITAGKTFRLQTFSMSVRATAATAGGAVATLRYNPSGAAVVGSPPVASAGGSHTNVIGASDSNGYGFGGVGSEFSGGQFLISFISVPATDQIVAIASGIEY